MRFVYSLSAGLTSYLILLTILQTIQREQLRLSLEFSLTGKISNRWFMNWPTKLYGRKRRQWAIGRSLPDFWDLMGLCLASGLSLQESFLISIVHMSPGALKNELNQTRQMIKVGGSLEAAVENLAVRIQDHQTTGAFALILQSIRRGSPLQHVLFEQAAALRRSQMLFLEKRAQTVGLRLLFPIMVFIFPTLFILLFGALYLAFLQNGSF